MLVYIAVWIFIIYLLKYLVRKVAYYAISTLYRMTRMLDAEDKTLGKVKSFHNSNGEFLLVYIKSCVNS